MESKQLKKFFVISVIFFVFALGYASSAQAPAEVVTQNATIPEPPSEPKQACVCDGALLPRFGENGKEIEICPHCKCKYENRNTTLIKVVVIIVIWIISILVIYMLFLMCLDPLLNKRVKANYQEHTNEDVLKYPSVQYKPLVDYNKESD